MAMPAPYSIFTSKMLFLKPNQQCQSIEGSLKVQLAIILLSFTKHEILLSYV